MGNNRGSGRFRLILAGTACLIAGLIISAGFDWTPFGHAQKGSADQTTAVSKALPLTADLRSPFVAVAKKAGPAVVNISSKRYTEIRTRGFQTPYDDFFREFFPEFRQPEPEKRQRKIEGQGSGFIIDKKGYILTNNHVVDGNPELTVKISDSREFAAEIIGTDPKTDLAVIRLKGLKEDLPAGEVAVLGNSDEIEVGDYAVAIGNPFGLERTVTQGIISYKGRSGLDIQGGGPLYQDFIQTDASINFGNSGGPLVNLRGEVIGINTAINAAGQGIGFAIPINMAKNIADQLMDKGKVVRGYLGVLPQEVTPELAEGFGLKDMGGVLIAKVEEGTPAAKAGLQDGDIIVKFNGKDIPNLSKFRQIVADSKVGDKVQLVVLRDKARKTLNAVIGEMPGETVVKTKEETEPKIWLGIRKLYAADSEQAKAAGITEKEGAVIADIEPDSPADEAGLAKGDIIKKINNRTIKNLSDYSGIIKDTGKGDKPVIFLVKRGQNTLFVAVKGK
jgi:serine protease Do